MSGWVTLTLRSAPPGAIEIPDLLPARTATLDQHAIATLPVRVGRTLASVGDFFDVAGSTAEHIRLVGDLTLVHGVGASMSSGEIVVEGDAGARAGERMAGGTLRIRGRAGDDAARAMSGGLMVIEGDAGDRLAGPIPGAAKGMSGGEVIVRGHVGNDAGARTRRGLLVAGTLGADAGRATIAGTILSLGAIGAHPGRRSKRGSLIALGEVDVPATYRYACTYEPGYLRLLLLYLKRTHGVAIPEDAVTARYRRYCGDAGEPGKGEILVRRSD